MPAPSLLDRLAGLTDPRSRHGRQYPLVPMLALCLVATLAGCTSVAAIAQFGRLRRHRLGHALGFHHGKMPAANTITDLLAALDPDHLDRVIGDWLADRHADGWDHIALDGKVLRGSRDGDAPGVHLLAAYAPQASAVIARMTVEATTNEHKTALRLLGVLPLAGAVVTADAMFSHADVCEKILEKHGDYVLYAKDNRSQLKADIEAAFAAAEGGDFPPLAAHRVAGGRGRGHVAVSGSRSNRAADAHHDDVAQRVPAGRRVAAGVAGVPVGAGADGGRGDDGGGGVRDHQRWPGDARRGAVAGGDAGPLGDRERAAPHPRRDVPRGPVSGAAGERAARAGVVAERGGVPAAEHGPPERAGRHPRNGRVSRPRSGPSHRPNFNL